MRIALKEFSGWPEIFMMMTAVGLQWLRTDHYLPQQHVMIFTKP